MADTRVSSKWYQGPNEVLGTIYPKALVCGHMSVYLSWYQGPNEALGTIYPKYMCEGE